MKQKDKYVVVTGASTGIGRAIAVGLAKQEDVIVHLVGINKKGLEETKRLVEKSGGTGWVQACDLSNIDEINKLVE